MISARAGILWLCDPSGLFMLNLMVEIVVSPPSDVHSDSMATIDNVPWCPVDQYECARELSGLFDVVMDFMHAKGRVLDVRVSVLFVCKPGQR